MDSDTTEHDPVSPELRAFVDEYGDEEVVIYHGYDDAVVGMGTQFTRGPVLIYDYEKIIAALVNEGMSEDEAVEYYDFNIEGSWVGERTPVIVNFRFEPARPPAPLSAYRRTDT